MNGAAGYQVISALQKRWRRQHLLALALLSLAITLPLVVVLYYSIGANLWWTLPVAALLFFAIATLYGGWRIQKTDVARTLNTFNPELEESAGLLLKEKQELGLLENLQVQKINNRLTDIEPPNPVNNKIRASLAILLCSAVICTLFLLVLPYLQKSSSTNVHAQTNNVVDSRPEKVLPAVKGTSIRIAPPANTGLAPRTQQRFNLRAEQGAIARWQLNISGEPASVQIVFNDSTRLMLRSSDTTKTTWTTEKRLTKNGFYQVMINDELSEFYQLEVIPDRPPVITVQTPRPSTIIEYGQAPRVSLTLNIGDDYGISQTSIFATVASGNGEAVKFREEQLSFDAFKAGGKNYQLAKAISLPGLNMQPGDELYFYISAVDNLKQETRSDIFTVKMEDTAALLSMDGMMSGVDLKPEFFRSQRQIIIETEQLLKGRDTMSREAFNNKCNDLGIDQKLLRLRYGKFLGEESETNIGEEGNTGHEEHEGEEDDHEEISIEDFNNAQKIIDRYAHKHDIAEDATFFDPQTKSALKATLAEMWEAELRLRTYKPKEALPYEYKALRLLKELQQKSREYVAKTSARLTPLKPAEKRLTGELDKIIEPVRKVQSGPGNSVNERLRIALSLVSLLKDSAGYQPTGLKEIELLREAAGQLGLKASADPATYLAGFEALNKLLRNEAGPGDPPLIAKALQKLISETGAAPVTNHVSPDNNLSTDYFMNLKSGRRS